VGAFAIPTWIRRPLRSATSHFSALADFKQGFEQLPSLNGQRVEHHLPVAAGTDDGLLAKPARVMRDKTLWALKDPREIAHTELLSLEQRRGESEAGRIGQCPRTGGRCLRSIGVDTSPSQLLCDLEVETEQIAVISGHPNTLTYVDVRSVTQNLRDYPVPS
jgi:hypothetical protein